VSQCWRACSSRISRQLETCRRARHCWKQSAMANSISSFSRVGNQLKLDSFGLRLNGRFLKEMIERISLGGIRREMGRVEKRGAT
jgi:hypothetical protein